MLSLKSHGHCLESRRRWEDYTRAKEIMLERTHIPEAPWWVVHAVDKKRARLNCIYHLLQLFQYAELPPKPPIVLPERERHEHYSRQAVPAETLLPRGHWAAQPPSRWSAK